MANFGLFFNAGAALGSTHDEVFRLTLEQAELADRLGYYDLWVSEHHFIPFGINPSALTLAAFLLGRTQRMRVGTAVTLAPLYHPLQLAGQVALLDQCSGGRLDFGIGRGGYLEDYKAFGVNTDRWSDEVEATATLLLKAWTEEKVESDNPWFPFSAVSLNPRPLSRPHPPLFLATSTPGSVAFAASNDLPLLHYWGTPHAARQKVEEHYAEAASSAGRDAPPHIHSLIVLVGDDEAALRARLTEALIAAFDAGDWPHVPQMKNRHVDANGNPVPREMLAQFVASEAIIGPEDVVKERLTAFRHSFGASRFVLYMEAIPDRALILSSIERFAANVMPHFSPDN